MLQMNDINVRKVLKNLNLVVEKGEFVLLIGDNGAGKTTLFNTIAGNITPTSGDIFINGENVTKKSTHERAALIANVFQDPKMGTVGAMTIRDNLNMSLMRGKKRNLRASCSEERDEIFKEKLRELDMGLECRLDDYVGELSGGQRQALSIEMTLLSESKIILLDEITAALDAANSQKILEIVARKCKGKTCLMITHNREHLKLIPARIAVLKNGQIE